ncbi:MAG: hypothetical protein LBC65_05160, partial [Oscillospiraceae bacterium]|nr:hypothetical protein [Oscillospiraceae bacterium]
LWYNGSSQETRFKETECGVVVMEREARNQEDGGYGTLEERRAGEVWAVSKCRYLQRSRR